MREKGEPYVHASKVRWSFLVLAAIAIPTAYRVRTHVVESAANYKLKFEQPTGWKKMPLLPGMVFVYRDDTGHFWMRGAVNNMVADVNPTPNMDAEAVVQQYVDVTVSNLTGWHYALLDPVEAHGIQFRLIRRWTDNRCVVSAVAVQGNTTVIVALVGDSKVAPHMDESITSFRQYLAGLSLYPYTYPNT